MDAMMNLMTQLGYHFYEDTKHYTRAKLENWLESVGGKAQWICLKSSCSTAIPEVVLLFCAEHHIKPIVQFDLADWATASPQEFVALLQYYKKNGVEFIQLDGYFNQRSTWHGIVQSGNFLAQLAATVVEFHQLAEEYGFYHVFPKLMPGGDYWDLVVVKHLLTELHQAEINHQTIVLTFTAWLHDNPLLWGKGGKRKWSEPQPYQKVFNGEDHRGLMGFEWYQEIAEDEFGRQIPVILMEAGRDVFEEDPIRGQQALKDIIDYSGQEGNKKVFSKVLGICVSYDEQVFTNEIADYICETVDFPQVTEETLEEKALPEKPFTQPIQLLSKRKNEKCVSHYLLLPEYDWGISPWHLEVALPFIRKYRPTIGYSKEEAKNATFVTIVMDDDVFNDADIDTMRKAGCKVAVIYGDGTEIAAKLASE